MMRPPSLHFTAVIGLALLGIALAACAEGTDRAGLDWVAEHDTIGDTVVVRTLSGSVWGDTANLVADLTIGQFDGPDEYMFGRIRSLAVGPDGSIYVFDSHAQALRKYAPDGAYLATFGQEGGGPGEYKRPDGGLAVLADGRVLLRDPGNARITIYASDGEYLDSWRIRGGLNTSRRLDVDTAGNAYVFLLINQGAPVTEWQRGLARYGPDGVPGDTLRPPSWDYEEPRLVASVNDGENRSMSVSGVPFSPETMWSFSPLGYMVGALSTRYAIDLYRAPGWVLRIERTNWKPAPVLAPEREEQEAIMTANMRFTEPGWRWDGPPIPEAKPPFSNLYAGDDGRIWVQLHQEAYQIESDEAEIEPESNAVPEATWIEPVAFDVFEPDGRYLGMVRAPKGFSAYPTPVFRGDTVWAVLTGEFDVPYVVRLKIEHPEDET